MKMLNKVETGLNRWDMMTEIKKMQITLDRMYGELQADGSRGELDALKGAIANLNYALMQINNKRDPQEAA
jgi:hypothetical protein